MTCGDPGIPDNAVRIGDSFLYEDTVVFSCNNGYYQSSGAENGSRICQDTGFWSETQPVCSCKSNCTTCMCYDLCLVVVVCTNIENCADIRCTDPTDHYCYKCASNNGVGLGERGYENFNTSCERKLNDVKIVQLIPSIVTSIALCSWLDAFCYPGVCTAGPSTCNCSAGFSGSDCLQSKYKPALHCNHYLIDTFSYCT